MAGQKPGPHTDSRQNARHARAPKIQPVRQIFGLNWIQLKNGKHLILAALIRVQDIRDGQSKFRQKERCNDIAASEEALFRVDVA